jgi:hypothetical protein
VWSSVIVEPQPAAERSPALGVGAIGAGVGPLIEQGLVEPLDLASCLRTVRAGPLEGNPQASGGLGEGDRLGVGLGVVGQDPLDPYPMVGEEAGRLDQKQRRGQGGLIREELAEGDPGAVIDRRVDIVVADPATGWGAGAAAVGAVAAAIRDAAQLLDVDVDQLAGMLALVADDHPAGPVGVGESALAMTGQDPIAGRAGHVKPPGQAMGPWRWRRRAASTRRAWTAVRAWGSGGVGSCGRPARPGRGSGSGQATCRRWPATPQALGRLGSWPAELGDALDQKQPTEVGQASISMGHEGPLPARGFDNPSRPRGPSTVNNPHGNYT